jgi:hypothetical protein
VADVRGPVEDPPALLALQDADASPAGRVPPTLSQLGSLSLRLGLGIELRLLPPLCPLLLLRDGYPYRCGYGKQPIICHTSLIGVSVLGLDGCEESNRWERLESKYLPRV